MATSYVNVNPRLDIIACSLLFWLSVPTPVVAQDTEEFVVRASAFSDQWLIRINEDTSDAELQEFGNTLGTRGWTALLDVLGKKQEGHLRQSVARATGTLDRDLFNFNVGPDGRGRSQSLRTVEFAFARSFNTERGRMIIVWTKDPIFLTDEVPPNKIEESQWPDDGIDEGCHDVDADDRISMIELAINTEGTGGGRITRHVRLKTGDRGQIETERCGTGAIPVQVVE